MKSNRSSYFSIQSSWNSSTDGCSLTPITTTNHCRSNSSASSSFSILDLDFPMPPSSRPPAANIHQQQPTGIPKPLRFDASPLFRLLTSIPISPSFDPSKPPEIPLPPLPPPSPYKKRVIPSLSTPPPQVPLPPIPATTNNQTDTHPKRDIPPHPVLSPQLHKAASAKFDGKQACQGSVVDPSRTLIIGHDLQAPSAIESWSSTTLHDQICSPDQGAASNNVEKAKMEHEKSFLTEIDYSREPTINQNISSNRCGGETLDDLVTLSEEDEVQAVATIRSLSRAKADLRSFFTASERQIGAPRQSDCQISPFGTSHWDVFQEKILADDGQGEDTVIDLNEPLDTLAKRLGYQAAPEVEEEDAVQSTSPPSSPSMTIFEGIEERGSNYSFLHSQLLLSSGDDELATTVVATNTEELPASSSSWRSASHCSSTSSVEPTGQQPLTTPSPKPATSFTPGLERARFSLAHLDLGSSTKVALDLKRSLSASSCAPKSSHRYLHSSQMMMMKRRLLPMKVIEEPSSSEEEEFDLSLDHRSQTGRGVCSSSSLIRKPSMARLERTTSMSQFRSVANTACNSKTMIKQPVSRLVRPKPSASLLGSSPIARSESVSQATLESCVWTKPMSQLASKATPLSGLTKPSSVLSGSKLVPPLPIVPPNSTKSTSAMKPATRFSTINPSPALSRTASCSAIPAGQPYYKFASLSLPKSARFKSSLPSFAPCPQPVKRSTHGPVVMTPATSSVPSALGLIPPPGRPGSLERRQWLCAGLSIKPMDSNARRFISSSSTSDNRRASSSAILGKKVEQMVQQESKSVTKNGWELEVTSNLDEDETLVDIVADNRDTQEKSDIEPPQPETLLVSNQLNGSPVEIAKQTNVGTSERRLKLKPLWLSSAFVLPEDNSLRTLRSPISYRNSLPLSTTAAASQRVTESTKVESTEPSAPRRSSMGFSPARHRLAHHQLLHHRRSLASLDYHHRAATSAAPISIRQLVYS